MAVPAADGDEGSARAKRLFKQAVQGTVWMNRLRAASNVEDSTARGGRLPHAAVKVNVDVGSLGHFIHAAKLPHVFATSVDAEDAASPGKQPASPSAAAAAADYPSEGEAAVSSAPESGGGAGGVAAAAAQAAQPAARGGSRRRAPRVGDKVTETRIACPRNQQLRGMLPSLQQTRTPRGLRSPPATAHHLDIMAPLASPSSSSGAPAGATPRGGGGGGGAGGGARQEGPPQGRGSSGDKAPSPSKASPGGGTGTSTGTACRRKRPETGFTLSFSGGLGAKPRSDQHPLLSAMEEGDSDVHHRDHEPDVQQAVLAHRLAELRWSEPRRGPWAAPPEARKPPQADDGALLRAAARQALEARPGVPGQPPARGHSHHGHGRHGHSAVGVSEEWASLVQEMDPENTGTVSQDALVPLMFWLGLTRRRSAALVTLELAFGRGDIPTDALRELCPYRDVQVRLVEGLRQLARRESLEQLCEFMTDNDLLRIRAWFYSMKRSPNGQVDLVEVQNLFAREGVTSDRQALFRFLSHVARSETLPARGCEGDGKGGAKLSKFGIEEFASIISRCTVAWCLHRTLALISTPSPGASAAAEGNLAENWGKARQPGQEDHDVSLRWTQLQRKIVVSMLINHRFWGRESRHVLNSLKPPGTTSIGEELTAEQWQCLFQRVRAQGMAAILPQGQEAEDPGFLVGKTRHTDIAGEQPA